MSAAETWNSSRGSGGSNNPSGASGGSAEQPNDQGSYECNICLDTAKDAVVSYCGHLFW